MSHLGAKLHELGDSLAAMKVPSAAASHAFTVRNWAADRKGCSECAQCLVSGVLLRAVAVKRLEMVHDVRRLLAFKKHVPESFSLTVTQIQALLLLAVPCSRMYAAHYPAKFLLRILILSLRS